MAQINQQLQQIILELQSQIQFYQRRAAELQEKLNLILLGAGIENVSIHLESYQSDGPKNDSTKELG